MLVLLVVPMRRDTITWTQRASIAIGKSAVPIAGVVAVMTAIVAAMVLVLLMLLLPESSVRPSFELP